MMNQQRQTGMRRSMCPLGGISTMKVTRTAGRRGFTLMEVIVVVIILGILALIALPSVGDVTTTTSERSVRSNLAALRNAIELYANQHNGVYPAGATDGSSGLGTEGAFVGQLTKYSNAAGVVSSTKSASYPYGPYLKMGVPSVTAGSLNGNNGVSVSSSATALSADGSPSKGWKYSYVTGQIICNSTATDLDGIALSAY